jgi:hypothetical protein
MSHQTCILNKWQVRARLVCIWQASVNVSFDILAGADVNAVAKKGPSALQAAVIGGYDKVCWDPHWLPT